jgi:choice-of-anchor B domain-containing protein
MPVKRNKCTISAALLLSVFCSFALACPRPGSYNAFHHPNGNSVPAKNGQPFNKPLTDMALTPCASGMAGTFPCQNINLLSLLPLAQMGGGSGSEVWGWTDPLTGKEYAIFGRSSGTAFIDLSNPESPVYLGNLPTASVNSSWRTMRVYGDHAFIGSEASNHGIQVFDLRQLRNVTNPPVNFTATANYTGLRRTHTLTINEETGVLYAAGSADTCSGGLHMVNVKNPRQPTFIGCFASDGYTHEAQCVNYHGPDAAYRGHEICANSNEDTLTIVDVTNKNAPVMLSRTGYTGRGYTHQTWFTDDQAYILLNDELDERNFGGTGRTYVWNMTDLDAPQLIGTHQHNNPAIDHNLYIRGNYVYESNYRSGLRILSLNNIANGSLQEVGFFDIYPTDNNANFNGAWLNYPFFKSGIVLVSGIEQGLFVLRPTNLPQAPIELLTEINTERAFAFDSITLLRDPFPVVAPLRFTPDQRTRVTLLAKNINPSLQASTLAEAEDYLRNTYQVTVENIATVPDLAGFFQVTVKLPDSLVNRGAVWLKVIQGRNESNKAIIRIKQQ